MLLFAFPFASYAHPGRTDANGGHHDYKNKSGLGSYHYHHGMSAHLHPNGICPYSSTEASQPTTVSNPTPKPTVKVTNLSTVMNVGDTCKFDAVIEHIEQTDIQVTSSNTEVIAVNSDQTLSAKGTGTSTITIGNDTVSKNFTITVKEVYATGLEISAAASELQVGEQLKIQTDIIPANTTNQTVVFESSDDQIAEISDDGTITGVSSGNVTITVQTSNKISETLELRIFEVVPEAVQCEESVSVIVGDEQKFEIRILPENANRKEFTVVCDNEEVFRYEDDKIKALREGNGVLHIETWNGIRKAIPVKVEIIPVEAVTIIDSTEYLYSNTIDVSDPILLSAEIEPKNATYQDVRWESSDNSVVSVDNNEFLVKGIGKVTLTCTSHNDIVDSVEINIVDQSRRVLLLVGSIFGVTTMTASGVIIKKKRKQNMLADDLKGEEADELQEDK